MVSIGTENWKIEGIRGILFDKDGTLIDSHVYWGRIIEKRARALIRFYSLNQNWFPDLCLSMGYCLKTEQLLKEGPIALVSREEVIAAVQRILVSRGVPTKVDGISEVFAKEHENFLQEMLDFIRILPGVREFLAEVKRYSLKMAVVTTDTLKNTRKILEYLQIAECFESVVAKESTREPKVSGAPAVKALESLGLKASETICIGDAPMDLLMAKNSNIKGGIGVATGQINFDTLNEYSPYVVGSIAELKLS